MKLFHLIMVIILGVVPILIGAKFRSLKEKNEKYYNIGSSIQICAILSACVLIFGDIFINAYAFYIALGAVLIIYIITFAYIYIKFIKK